MLKFSRVGVLAAGLAIACASVALAQGKGETVKLQDYPGLGNILYRIAATKGYCDSHGIKCQLQVI